jgi:hypothetical protein
VALEACPFYLQGMMTIHWVIQQEMVFSLLVFVTPKEDTASIATVDANGTFATKL